MQYRLDLYNILSAGQTSNWNVLPVMAKSNHLRRNDLSHSRSAPRWPHISHYWFAAQTYVILKVLPTMLP